MIVLDTNVVSELIRARPEPGVLTWLDRHDATELYVTAVTTAELRYGVARLPESRRRTVLAVAVQRMIEEDFADRILPFDDEAASWYAQIVAGREARGAPIGTADAQIAAISQSHGATLATRNTKDFLHIGIAVVDPWSASG